MIQALLLLVSLSAHASIDHDFTSPQEAATAIRSLAQQFHANGNPRGLFAGIYAVTIDATVQRINEFKNPRWVSQLVVNYANIYRRTIYNELQGRRAQLPKTWQLTFNYEDDPTWSAELDVIYGIHVHIVRDLVEALYATPANFNPASVRADFYRVTEVLRGAMPQIWRVYSGYAFIFPGSGILAEPVMMEWIGRQRDYAWRAHFANLNYTSAQQQGFLGRIDRWAYDSALSKGVWLAFD